MSCELCDSPGGELLWCDEWCRVVLVDDPDYQGFCRVIWGGHVKEMSDLPQAQREHMMRVVFAAEHAVRQVLSPDKVNLASLGNVTPHLHWHVIPRFASDRNFPNPIWGSARRETQPTPAPGLADRLRAALLQALQA
jgi:diadenosine tetraphosphate (Ap4A) HIT family hydrolase